MARLGILEEIAAMLYTIGPPGFRRFIANLTPLPSVQQFKYIVDAMHQTATRFFQSRKLLVEQDGADNTGRDDLLSLLGRHSSLFHATHSYMLVTT
jgi:hypothetical protein